MVHYRLLCNLYAPLDEVSDFVKGQLLDTRGSPQILASLQLLPPALPEGVVIGEFRWRTPSARQGIPHSLYTKSRICS